MTDIRELLQKAERPGSSLDRAIAQAGDLKYKFAQWSTNYTIAIAHIESKGYDWIMGNVNGQMGGTPYGCVGVPDKQSSYSATPLLALWLSYFRLELGDEREAFRKKRYGELGIDPLNPNPDGSDFHLMNAVDDEIDGR